MPVGKGRCARDALHHIFDTGDFKIVKNNYTTKHIYKKSANMIECYKFTFDTNDF